jgi:hypothetical protein
MLTLKNFSIAAVVVIAGFFLYAHFFSDEARIQRQFKRLSTWVARGPDDQTLTLASRSNKIRRLFAASVSLHVGEDIIAGEYTNEDIRNMALNTLTYFTRVGLSFEELNIQSIAGDEARVMFSARFTAQNPDGTHIDEYRTLEGVLRKSEDTWLFASFDLAAMVENNLTQ